jgi:hypothetical protein
MIDQATEFYEMLKTKPKPFNASLNLRQRLYNRVNCYMAKMVAHYNALVEYHAALCEKWGRPGCYLTDIVNEIDHAKEDALAFLERMRGVMDGLALAGYVVLKNDVKDMDLSALRPEVKGIFMCCASMEEAAEKLRLCKVGGVGLVAGKSTWGLSTYKAVFGWEKEAT